MTSGLYRYSRNPMYVSVILAIVGWAVLTGAWGLLWYAGAVLVTFQLFVVFYEEPKLAELFGDEYAAYRKRVRRWLG